MRVAAPRSLASSHARGLQAEHARSTFRRHRAQGSAALGLLAGSRAARTSEASSPPSAASIRTPGRSLLNGVASRLVAGSTEPSFSYKITILNSPTVNAFSLPDGHLYVTRGLLALANISRDRRGARP